MLVGDWLVDMVVGVNVKCNGKIYRCFRVWLYRC